MNGNYISNHVKDFKNLKVWQNAIELSKDIYKITAKFPTFETYATTSQIIRSCNSISANIAEGVGQLYKKKEISFLNNALGSASETRNWLIIALNNRYITQEEYKNLDAKLVEIIKMLFGYIRSINQLEFNKEIS